MQKPLAARAIAWCRPPATLAPWLAAEVHTARAAAMVAPTTSALASCMCGNTGSSAVPSPKNTERGSSGSPRAASSPARLTAAR